MPRLRATARKAFYRVGLILLGLPVAGAVAAVMEPPTSYLTAIVIMLTFAGLQAMLYLMASRIHVLDAELLYILLHMRLVASGKPPVGRIFRAIADFPQVYGGYSRLFRSIYDLGKEWGYSFPKAVSIMADSVEGEILRNILQRLSGVLAVGEDVEEFFEREYRTLLAEYENVYTRTMNSARVLLGIYVTMLGSLVFLVSTFMVLAFFFGGDTRILYLSYAAVTVGAVLLGLLVFMSLKQEPFEYRGDPEILKYRLLKAAGGLAMALGAAVGAGIVYLRGGLDFTGLVMAYAAAGLLLLPIGILARMEESKVRNVDEFFPVFIRSYGSHLSTVGNMVKALEPLLISNLGILMGPIKRLYTRLKNSINPSIAWDLFSAETGSEMARRGIIIFTDTVEAGGDPNLAGALISDHHNDMNRLRKLRYQVASTFSSTLFIMHGAAIIILLIMSKLLELFSNILQQLTTQLPPEIASIFPFRSMDVSLLPLLNLVFVTTLVIVNSAVVTRVTPGSKTSFYFYLSLYLLLSAGSIFIAVEIIDFVIGSIVVPQDIVPQL
ncbi:type II secretion system F family protein [Aeropyrum camini]|uniref:type II secretion system F family protein n=1 Tax=Aeropyrum camini TaxID=229980 RepID=UPI0011E58AA5|nr:type II secretion system F family protein [Aeropyrum camini]